LTLRGLHCHWWQVYIVVCGPISWLGLIKAHVHPALALTFVVPFMPAKHAVPSGRNERRLSATASKGHKFRHKVQSIMASFSHAEILLQGNAEERAHQLLTSITGAPLHAFECALKLPVDIGMFFFGLANAGVQFSSVGGITASVAVGLILGKTVGVFACGMLAIQLGFDLPAGITKGDLLSLSALGGIGLTVALFVANEAFLDPGLQGQAKMGAVISVTAAALAWAVRWLAGGGAYGDAAFNPEEQEDFLKHQPNKNSHAEDETNVKPIAPANRPTDLDASEEPSAWVDDLVVEEVMQILWTQRRYAARGTKMPLTPSRRSISKETIRTANTIRRHTLVGGPEGARSSSRSSTWSNELKTISDVTFEGKIEKSSSDLRSKRRLFTSLP